METRGSPDRLLNFLLLGDQSEGTALVLVVLRPVLTARQYEMSRGGQLSVKFFSSRGQSLLEVIVSRSSKVDLEVIQVQDSPILPEGHEAQKAYKAWKAHGVQQGPALMWHRTLILMGSQIG